MPAVDIPHSASTHRFFKGQRLTGANEGLGGVYFVQAASEKQLGDSDYLNYDMKNSDFDFVFKPLLEEPRQRPGSFDEPAHFGDLSPVKNGVRVGDTSIKEYAAYLLDHDGRAGVPSVDLVANVILSDTGGNNLLHTFGSLHSFVHCESTAEDQGSGTFSRDNVHLVGLLDLRICNLDRHEGNLLVQRDPDSACSIIVPIDHGFSMPSWRDISDAYFCWQYWSQASEQFSEEVKAYVAQLRPLDDVPMLLKEGIGSECVLTYVLCSLLTQAAVKKDKTLREISFMISRDYSNPTESHLESIITNVAQETNFDTFEFEDDIASWHSQLFHRFLDRFQQKVDSYLCCSSELLFSSDSSVTEGFSAF